MRHITEPEPAPESDPQHVVTTGPGGALEHVVTTDVHGGAKRLVAPALKDGTSRAGDTSGAEQ